MSRWGMGMSSSDEYGEVKEEFFNQFYYTTTPLDEIQKSILDEYKEKYSKFEDDDGIWHDIYFALADCEWSCGQLTQEILSKVENIIVRKLDLAYMESLYASPEDLKTRSRVLDKFLLKIKTPKEKPISRKLKKPFVSPFKTGDVFLFTDKKYYYGGVVLQVYDEDPKCDEIYKKDSLNYCIAFAERSLCALSIEQIENSRIRCVEWLIPCCLPRQGKLEIIGNISNKISKDYRDYFCAYKSRYGLGFSGRFADDFVKIISADSNFDNYLKKLRIFDKPIYYLFNKKSLIKTKRIKW